MSSAGLQVVVDFIARVGNFVTGTTRATQSVNLMTRAVSSAGSTAQSELHKFRNLAGAFTALVAARRVGRAFADVNKHAMSMEVGMKRLSYLSGKTGRDLQIMRARAEEVARATIFSPQQMIDGLQDLYRATGDQKTAMALLAPAAQAVMATGNKMQFSKAVKGLASLSKAFGFLGQEAVNAMDKLQAASKASGAKLEDYMDIIPRLGLAGNMARQSFDEVLTFFSIANRVMGESKRTSTQMMRLFMELGSAKGRDALSQLGIRATVDSSGQLKNVRQLVMDILESMKTMPGQTREIINKSFSKASIKPLYAVIQALQKGMAGEGGARVKGQDIFDYMRRKIESSKGELTKASDVYQITAQAAVTRLSEAWGKFKTRLGEAFLDTVKNAIDSIGQSLEWLIAAVSGLSPTTKAILKFGLAFVAVSAALFMVVAATKGLAGIIGAVIARTGGLAYLESHRVLLQYRLATATTVHAKAVGVLRSAIGLLGPAIAGVALLYLPKLIDAVRELFDLVSKQERRAMARLGKGNAAKFIKGLKPGKSAGKIHATRWGAQTQKGLAEGGVELAKPSDSLFDAAGKWSANAGLGSMATRMAAKKRYEEQYKWQVKALNYRDKLMARRSKLQMAHLDAERRMREKIADYHKQSIIAGSRYFDEAVEKLKDTLKPQVNVMNLDYLAKLQAELKKMVSIGAGGMMHGRALTSDDVKGAKFSLARMATGIPTLKRSIYEKDPDKKPSGGEMRHALSLFGGANLFYAEAFPLQKKLYEGVHKNAIAPMRQSLTSKAMERHRLGWTIPTGGRDYSTGARGRVSKEYDPLLGLHSQSWSAQKSLRKFYDMDPNRHYLEGGTSGILNDGKGGGRNVSKRAAEAIVKSRNPDVVQAVEKSNSALKEIERTLKNFERDGQLPAGFGQSRAPTASGMTNPNRSQ
jgi:TP901 family phage tail tape measure protein